MIRNVNFIVIQYSDKLIFLNIEYKHQPLTRSQISYNRRFFIRILNKWLHLVVIKALIFNITQNVSPTTKLILVSVTGETNILALEKNRKKSIFLLYYTRIKY